MSLSAPVAMDELERRWSDDVASAPDAPAPDDPPVDQSHELRVVLASLGELNNRIAHLETAFVRELKARLDAVAYATELRMSAMESQVVTKLERRHTALARTARQRDRRLVTRIDDALRVQTDELLTTLDSWLPAEPEPEPVAPRPRRLRRWLKRALAVSLAAGSVAGTAIASGVTPHLPL